MMEWKKNPDLLLDPEGIDRLTWIWWLHFSDIRGGFPDSVDRTNGFFCDFWSWVCWGLDLSITFVIPRMRFFFIQKYTSGILKALSHWIAGLMAAIKSCFLCSENNNSEIIIVLLWSFLTGIPKNFCKTPYFFGLFSLKFVLTFINVNKIKR
jgi:hypothetical protein